MAADPLLGERRSGFLRHLGLTQFSLDPSGDIVLEVDLKPEHLNSGGAAHGGLYLSMLDSVLGAAVVRTLGPDEWTATQSLTTQFMAPATRGRLRAKGRIDRRGKLTAFTSGEVYDEANTLVARATGLWAIRKG
ncbi:MAG: PaaI family thioesterase [Thermoplasmatota archaeon]